MYRGHVYRGTPAQFVGLPDGHHLPQQAPEHGVLGCTGLMCTGAHLRSSSVCQMAITSRKRPRSAVSRCAGDLSARSWSESSCAILQCLYCRLRRTVCVGCAVTTISIFCTLQLELSRYPTGHKNFNCSLLNRSYGWSHGCMLQRDLAVLVVQAAPHGLHRVRRHHNLDLLHTQRSQP